MKGSGLRTALMGRETLMIGPFLATFRETLPAPNPVEHFNRGAFVPVTSRNNEAENAALAARIIKLIRGEDLGIQNQEGYLLKQGYP
ncbi:hypothetical protein FKM82_002577 [Ascaphus truei]